MTMATIDAARALRWDHEIGSLELGNAADVVVVDAENPASPCQPARWDFGALCVGIDVQSVVVAGRLVVDEGCVLTIDDAALLDEAVRVREKLGGVRGRRYRPLGRETVVS